MIFLWVALVTVLFLFRPLQRRLGEHLALRSEIMNQNWFRETIAHSANARRFVQRAWDSGKIPHRYEALSLLRDLGATNLFEKADFDRIVLSATADADESLRELAMATLAARPEQTLATAAVRQLRDVDPEMRRLGLQYLRGEDSRLALPALAETMADRDMTIAVNSLVMFQKVSGVDLGDFKVRALVEDPQNPEAISGFRRARSQAQDWWKTNQVAFTNVILTPLAPDPGGVLGDFTLESLEGGPVRLSDFRGKTVLLNFWTTWCSACRLEFAALNELQQKRTNDLVILGISLDGANGESFSAAPGATNEIPAETGKPGDLAAIRKEVTRVVKTQKLNYRILLDPNADIGARFRGGELPTNVLVDGEGRLRRRFVGARSLDVLEEMVKEIAKSPAP